DTHAITWTFNPPTVETADSGDGWRPTVLMQRVSVFVEQAGEPVSLRAVEDNVRGKSRTWIRKAIDELLVGGYIAETPGLRKARMLTHVRPFTTSPDLAPLRPANSGSTSPDLAHPLQGARCGAK